MATHQNLTHRQTVELLRRMAGGTVGFDYKKHSIAVLRATVEHWIAAGTATEEQCEAWAAAIGSEVPLPPPVRAAVAPPAPVVLPAPPRVAAPVLAPAVAVPVFAPVAPEPEPEPEPVVYAAPPAVAVAVADIIADATRKQPTHAPAFPRRVSVREVFADQPDVAAQLPADMMMLDYGSPDAPAVDTLYQFDAAILRRVLIAASLERPVPCWLAGAKGTGKTEFTRQIAARFGRPFFRVAFNRATEPAEILGDMGLRDGATVWQDGPVTMALRTPGAILLLDEITYAATGYLASLNPVLERNGAPLRLPRTGEQLNIAPDVAVFAADNTLGHGDTTGEYPSRAPMSADTRDRTPYSFLFKYLPAATEAKLLRQIVSRDSGKQLKAATATAIIKVAHVARDKSAAGELQGAPGLRACVAMAILMAHGEPATEAYECTVTLSAPPESHEELRAIFAAHWPSQDTDANTI